MAEMTFSANSVLPPIPAAAKPTDEATDAAEQVVSSKAKLRTITQHLIDEVLATESKAQGLLDELWKKAAEQVEDEKLKCKKRLDEMNSELAATRHELVQCQKTEQSLVEQQNRLSIELMSERKEHEKAATELKSMKEKFSSLQSRITEADSAIHKMKNEINTAKSSYQKDLEQKDQLLRENQEKAKKLSEKVQSLQEQLKVEKQSAQKLQQTYDGETSKKVTDNKKLLLEITKLKNQVRSSNSSLTEAQEEIAKLCAQLKRQHEATETNAGLVNKQHNAVVKGLQRKIESLENEIANMQSQYQLQIESLKDQLTQAIASQGSKEHYLDARIQFLTHQNRKEKDKLSKEIKNIAS